MSTAALLLVLCSAAMHAGWNLLGKGREPSLAFFTLAVLGGGLVFSPLLLVQPGYLQLPLMFWLLLLVSGFFQAIYMAGLAWAYARGEVSVLYPLARALPVLMVPLTGLMMLQGTALLSHDWLALSLIALASLLLPFPRLRELRLSRYLTPALAFVLLAAVGTTGYTLIDKAAIDLMQQQLGTPLMSGGHYMVLQAFASLIWMLPVILLGRNEQQALRKLLAGPLLVYVGAGVLVLATYGLVLVAMAMTDEISYLVALRQASIPLGALGGILLLKESVTHLKVLALLLLTSGLVLITF